MSAYSRLSRMCGPQVPPELLAELAAHRAEVLAEAIEAARSEYFTEITGTPEVETYNNAVSDVVAAIGALLETPASAPVPVQSADVETGEAPVAYVKPARVLPGTPFHELRRARMYPWDVWCNACNLHLYSYGTEQAAQDAADKHTTEHAKTGGAS